MSRARRSRRRGTAASTRGGGLLVLLVGGGFITITSDLLGWNRLHIIGATLAPVGGPIGLTLGTAFTARRARRRNSRPLPEGTASGLAGLTPLVIAAGYEILVAPEAYAPPLRRLNHVLYMAAFVQLRHDTEGQAYYRRKLVADANARREQNTTADPGGHSGATPTSSAAT